MSASEPPLLVGVVGAGVFGGHHASKYAADPDAQLIGVYDPSTSAAEALAARVGGSAFPSAAALFDAVDAVTIAAPASTHFELTRAALAAGCAALVEKPLALRVEQAETLAREAAEKGLALQVGHQERYVAAASGVLPATPLAAQEKGPIRLTFQRSSAPSDRGRDVSVVFDLMVHDLDLLGRFTAGRLSAVSAQREEGADRVSAELAFEDGVTAALTAARAPGAPARAMEILYPGGTARLDFQTRRVAVDGAPPPWAVGALGVLDETSQAATDPLGYAVNSFVKSVRTGAQIVVSGEDGARAVALAERIESAATANVA